MVSYSKPMLEQLLKARAAIGIVAKRGQKVFKDDPDLEDPIEKMLAQYHLTDNLPEADSEIKDDNGVKWFYLEDRKSVV